MGDVYGWMWSSQKEEISDGEERDNVRAKKKGGTQITCGGWGLEEIHVA